jgi:hypothetical protein
LNTRPKRSSSLIVGRSAGQSLPFAVAFMWLFKRRLQLKHRTAMSGWS